MSSRDLECFYLRRLDRKDRTDPHVIHEETVVETTSIEDPFSLSQIRLW